MYGAEVPDLCVLLASVFPWNGGQWWCSSCLKLGLAENVYLAGFAPGVSVKLYFGDLFSSRRDLARCKCYSGTVRWTQTQVCHILLGGVESSLLGAYQQDGYLSDLPRGSVPQPYQELGEGPHFLVKEMCSPIVVPHLWGCSP